MSPGGARRITSGKVVAAGPSRWLAVECGGAQPCVNVVIDRADFARHVLPGPALPTSQPLGVISPNGSAAPLAQAAGALSPIDLSTGVEDVLNTAAGAGTEWGGVMWSPGSRWLFAVDAGDHLSVVDARTRHISDLPIPLPYIEPLAISSMAK